MKVGRQPHPGRVVSLTIPMIRQIPMRQSRGIGESCGSQLQALLLVTEKATLRAAEFAAAGSHLARLRDGHPESIESSSLYLDILRDLKR
jgi:hypothetical protein